MSLVDDASAHSSNSRSSSAHNDNNDSADEDTRDNSDNRVVLSLKDKGENTVIIFSKQYLDAVADKYRKNTLKMTGSGVEPLYHSSWSRLF